MMAAIMATMVAMVFQPLLIRYTKIFLRKIALVVVLVVANSHKALYQND
jgi:hypothetical protein